VVAQVPGNSEVAAVLQEEGCGLTVAPDDAQGLAKAIEELADDPARTERLGCAAFEAYQRSYTLAAGIRTFDLGWSEWTGAARPK
jgi:glycosyltransferase involved in cell wall biosynthesis